MSAAPVHCCIVDCGKDAIAGRRSMSLVAASPDESGPSFLQHHHWPARYCASFSSHLFARFAGRRPLSTARRLCNMQGVLSVSLTQSDYLAPRKHLATPNMTASGMNQAYALQEVVRPPSEPSCDRVFLHPSNFRPIFMSLRCSQ
jgi:hypothetical protein